MNTELINRPCNLLVRGPSGQEDDYGNVIESETDVATVCEVQQKDRSESGDAGETGKGEWIGFFLPDQTGLNTASGLIVDNARYEFVGPPWLARDPFTQQSSHWEVDLRQVAGAEDVGS